jgi:GNAT superfamily N-acetyltransferase
VDIQLRPFVPSDASTLARVWHESWVSTGVPAAREIKREDLLARVQTELAQGWHVTVAEISGELVGFLALKLDERRLEQLFMAPKYKGPGIGARLFALAEEMMPRGFVLRTAAANIEARRFYEKRGMRLDRMELHRPAQGPRPGPRWSQPSSASRRRTIEEGSTRPGSGNSPPSSTRRNDGANGTADTRRHSRSRFSRLGRPPLLRGAPYPPPRCARGRRSSTRRATKHTDAPTPPATSTDIPGSSRRRPPSADRASG